MTHEPAVCRMAHYVAAAPIRADGTQAYPSACRAAVITEVGEAPTAVLRILNPVAGTRVGLCVLNPAGLFFHSLQSGGCAYDGGSGTAEWSCDGVDHEGGTWHWPVRVGP